MHVKLDDVLLRDPSLTPEEILERAAVIEGHPDNAAPAIFGATMPPTNQPPPAPSSVRIATPAIVITSDEDFFLLSACSFSMGQSRSRMPASERREQVDDLLTDLEQALAQV